MFLRHPGLVGMIHVTGGVHRYDLRNTGAPAPSRNSLTRFVSANRNLLLDCIFTDLSVQGAGHPVLAELGLLAESCLKGFQYAEALTDVSAIRLRPLTREMTC